MKKRIKKLISEQYVFQNRQLQTAIRTAFANFHTTLPGVQFGAKLKDDYEYGLLALCTCYDYVMNREMVMDGFRCCGQDCVPDKNGVTIDFHKMMSQCYSDVSREQLNIMQDKAPALVEIVKAEGTVTYSQFIACGILPGPTSIDRDDLTHIRHWSEIINHEKVVERFEAEQRAKDPLYIEMTRAQALLQKPLDKRHKPAAASWLLKKLRPKELSSLLLKNIPMKKEQREGWPPKSEKTKSC